jgi:hypothetical protein
MRSVKYFTLATLAVVTAAGLGVYRAAEDKALEIEAVMEKAHKPPQKGQPSLFKTVSDGKGSQEQKEELLKLYSNLGKNKPPKGDEADWKKRTDTLVGAAKGVVADKSGSLAALKKAANCKACHDAHKSD